MKRYLDPEILGLRLSAKVGGNPFQLVLGVEGKNDLLVLDGTQRVHQLMTRKEHQGRGEFRSWSVSEFSDLDPADALKKVRTKIRKVELLIGENARWVSKEFAVFADLVDWLGDANEPTKAATIQFPSSTHKGLKKLAKRRKIAGGRGTLKEVVVAASDEYIERHL